MLKIETSDGKDWFDVNLQTYMSGELQYSTQTVKFTSDWNGLDLIKGGASFTVSDMCPYLLSNAPVLKKVASGLMLEL